MNHQEGQGKEKQVNKALEYQKENGYLIQCKDCKLYRNKQITDCPACTYSIDGRVTSGATGRYHR